jgi:exonuclease III
MNSLSISQYNTHASLKVMSPLLTDLRTKCTDIIALQEPYFLRSSETSHCPAASPFVLAYEKGYRRTAFLVRKSIPQTEWTVSFPSPDICSLTLRTTSGIVHIHNVYIPPRPLAARGDITQLRTVRELLGREGSHILLGDFNLHHPLWAGIALPTQHHAADQLIDLTTSHDLELATPQGLVTRSFNGQESTLDLIFLSPDLSQRVVSCSVESALDHGSDHLPVRTTFNLQTVPEPINSTQRVWKNMRTDAVFAEARRLRLPSHLRTTRDIDDYSLYVSQFTSDLISKTVPLHKPSDKAAPWWSDEIYYAVNSVRALRRYAERTKTPESYEHLKTASRARDKLVTNSKRKSFRNAVHQASTDGTIWPLARWARGKKKGLSPVPPLRTSRDAEPTAFEFADKVDMFKDAFFPQTEADLSDIPDTERLMPRSAFRPDSGSFSNDLEVSSEVSYEDIRSILSSKLSWSAPGHDYIPFGFLKAMGPPIIHALRLITDASWKLGHFPALFKQARTVVIKKPQKPSYEVTKGWRPIALLPVIGKVVETITARRLAAAAEAAGVLPDTQMGNRTNRSTEHVLDLITSQVNTVWESKRHVASLLSLDIAGAFDTVNHTRLLQVVRQRGAPLWLLRWLSSFLSDRTTSLLFDGKESEPFSITRGVPQGSPLSPILFLFYNSELLEACTSRTNCLSPTGFADDANILTYGTSTEGNCQRLQAAFVRCQAWARRFGVTFAPDKFELIHFTRSRTKFNLAATVRLDDITVAPSTVVRVLGVWLDTKLRWGPHIREAVARSQAQAGALDRLANSTWGASFTSARRLYTAIVRPSMAYCASAWSSAPSIVRKLGPTQNKCLRAVAGAYKATPTRELETETFIPPIDLYLQERSKNFRQRIKNTPYEQFKTSLCQHIRRKILSRHQRYPRSLFSTPSDEPLPLVDAWTERWNQHRDRTKEFRWELATSMPNRDVLKLHRDLFKAESSALIQFRTGRTGLNRFLASMRVPNVDPQCKCGFVQETPRHVLFYCNLEDDRRPWRRRTDLREFVLLLSSPDTAKDIARWILGIERLSQFKLANNLLPLRTNVF